MLETEKKQHTNQTKKANTSKDFPSDIRCFKRKWKGSKPQKDELYEPEGQKQPSGPQIRQPNNQVWAH